MSRKRPKFNRKRGFTHSITPTSPSEEKYKKNSHTKFQKPEKILEATRENRRITPRGPVAIRADFSPGAARARWRRQDILPGPPKFSSSKNVPKKQG